MNLESARAEIWRLQQPAVDSGHGPRATALRFVKPGTSHVPHTQPAQGHTHQPSSVCKECQEQGARARSASGPCRLFRRATKIAARTLNRFGHHPEPSRQKRSNGCPALRGWVRGDQGPKTTWGDWWPI